MPDLITSDTVSKEMLKSIFDRAFMETSYDSDGDLRIKDGISCWVMPEPDRIKLVSHFGFRPGSIRLKRLEFVNRLNQKFIMVRASVGDRNDILRFDHVISIRGGVTQIAVVQTAERFLSIIPPAVKDCDTEDIVE
jgi:hypothetical protein